MRDFFILQPINLSAYLAYVTGLFAFRALGYFEFDLVAFCQGFIAVSFDSAIMNEHVFSVFARDEAITFLIAEPLYFTFSHEILFTSSAS